MTSRSRFQDENLRSIDDVHAALQLLGHDLSLAELAMLRNFNQAYLIITANVRSELKKGNFEHPDFLNRFDTRFAYYYFKALHDYIDGYPTPPAWRMAFEAARHSQTTPLIAMALGVNAHVNNDIPQVLRDSQAQAEHYRDYVLINTIIKDSIYETIDALDSYDHPLNPKQRLMKPLYKLVMTPLIALWRYTAWRKYRRLEQGSLTIATLEKLANRLANGITKLPV